MSFIEKFPIGSDLRLYSNPEIAQQNAFKYFGNNAHLYPSKVKGKKYAIMSPEGKIINFGAIGYADYTFTKNAKKRHNFLARTAHGIQTGYNPNNLSRRILW
jgi:hypothetical protein